MSKTYFIDSENVGDNWVALLDAVSPGDEILVFYTLKSPHMNYKNLRILKESSFEVTFIECTEGSNALDFQLATELGYRLHDIGDGSFIIVTNDNGYDAIVKYWHRHGKNVRRIQGKACALESAAASTTTEPTDDTIIAETPDLKDSVAAKAETKAKTGTKVKTEGKVKTDAKAETESKANTEAKAETEIRANTEAKAEAQAESKEDVKAASAPEPRSEQKADQKSEQKNGRSRSSRSRNRRNNAKNEAKAAPKDEPSAEAPTADVPAALAEAESAEVPAAKSAETSAATEASEAMAIPAETTPAEITPVIAAPAPHALANTAGTMTTSGMFTVTKVSAGSKTVKTLAADGTEAAQTNRAQAENRDDAATAEAVAADEDNEEAASIEATITEATPIAVDEAAAETVEAEAEVEADTDIDTGVDAGPAGAETDADSADNEADAEPSDAESPLADSEAETTAEAEAQTEAETRTEAEPADHAPEYIDALAAESADPDGTPEIEETAAAVIDQNAQELLFLIGRNNLQQLHEALQQLYGTKKATSIYNTFKADTAFNNFLANHAKMSRAEKQTAYCSIVFEITAPELEMPDGFPKFAADTWKAKKNLNSFRSSLMQKYGKDAGSKLYTVFKAHIKILDII